MKKQLRIQTIAALFAAASLSGCVAYAPARRDYDPRSVNVAPNTYYVAPAPAVIRIDPYPVYSYYGLSYYYNRPYYGWGRGGGGGWGGHHHRHD